MNETRREKFLANKVLKTIADSQPLIDSAMSTLKDIRNSNNQFIKSDDPSPRPSESLIWSALSRIESQLNRMEDMLKKMAQNGSPPGYRPVYPALPSSSKTSFNGVELDIY